MFFLLFEVLNRLRICCKAVDYKETLKRSNPERYNTLGHAISLLQQTSGISTSEMEGKNIIKRLECVCVGTEKAKRYVTPVKPEKLIPLSELKIESNKVLLERMISSRNEQESDLPATVTNAAINDSNDISDAQNVLITETLDKDIVVLKKGNHSALLEMVCDFCLSNFTTHACRFEMAGGKKTIEGDNTRICGLEFCLECREKHNNNKGGNGNCLSFHHHPQCKSNFNNNTTCDTLTIPNGIEVESLNATETNKFLPNYISVQSCIEALRSLKEGVDNPS